MIGSQEINAGNEMQDDINRLVEEKKSAANFKICSPCKQETPFSQRTCQLCKTKLVKYGVHFNDKASSKVDPYDHFNVKPLENEIDVVVGEPDMLNPSCYQNISKILTFVGEPTSIDRYCKEEKEKQRKWIFLENDGGIMNPAMKLFSMFIDAHVAKKKCTVVKTSRNIYALKLFISHLLMSLIGLFNSLDCCILK